LVRFACLITETGDAAGRTGMGAVMGSKKLKAIAVRGFGSIDLAKPKEFLDLSIQVNREIREHPTYQEHSTYGTARVSFEMYEKSFFPVGNFEDVCWEDIIKADLGTAYVDKHQFKNVGCFCCPNRCMNFYDVPHIGKGVTSCRHTKG
jgi:aldehyde:ferredoxin oxidoreductase